MMKAPPSPITNENFPEFWTYTDKKLRQVKSAVVADRIAGWIGNLIFLAGCVLIVYGLLQMHPSSTFRAYLDGITFLKDALNIATDIIMNPAYPGPVPVILLMLSLYGIPLAASIVVTVLIRLIYRPRKADVPTGSDAENSKLLLEKTKLVQVYRKRIGNDSSADLTSTGLFMISCALLICGYIVEALVSNNETLIATLLMEITPATLTLPSMAAFLSYAAVHYILIHLLAVVSYCHVSPTLQEDAQRYHMECDPDEKERLAEEDRILALAKQIMERRAQEAQRLRNG